MQATLRKRVNNTKGVTLVELLAVLVILGIIALIAVPAIAGVIDDSKENSIKSTAINTINAVELYMITNNVGDPSEVSHSDVEGEYVNDRDGFNWDVTPTFSTKGGEVSISGTGNIDGTTVRFDNYTINDINNLD